MKYVIFFVLSLFSQDDKDIEFEIKIYAGGTGRMDFSLTRGIFRPSFIMNHCHGSLCFLPLSLGDRKIVFELREGGNNDNTTFCTPIIQSRFCSCI